MPRSSLQKLTERRRREAGRAGDRFVDLCLKIVHDDSGEVLLRVGGRWDRRRKDWSGPSKTARVVRVHKGQLDGARWLADWFKNHLSGRDKQMPVDDRVFSMMLGGGQRSGKTWLGVSFPAIAYAIAVPGSIVWIVSPAERDHEEIQEYLRTMMPRAWYSQLGAPWYRYRLPNGSKIVLRTGHEPDKLKKGDADLIVMNEAQQQKERAFAICRGRIASAGGLVVLCANPPEEEIGQWVGDFAVEAEEGLRQARFFHLDPLDNPHIDHAPLLAMAKEFDQHTFDVEVRGLFLGGRNAALYNWTRLENEKVPPARPDITAEVLRHLEGRAYDRAIGVDIQRYPHMASTTFQFYENPRATGGKERLEWSHMWATASLILKAADEADLARAWLDAGYDPDRTLIVCDASGEWQFAERDPLKVKELRNKVQGRGSFDVFRMFGFRHIVKPDRDMEKNPDVNERFRASTSRICTAIEGPYGRRFVFSDPRNKELNKAIRMLPTKNGKPVRYSKFAHACDSFTYPIARFFPRRIKEKPPEIKAVGRPFERRKQMAAY